MEYLVGVALAVAVGVFGSVTGMDRDRAFYPTVAIVIASYYALFAISTDSIPILIAEVVAACVFLALAVVGFKRTLWLVVIALAGHGVFDFFHHHLITDPGVPAWWPGFCLAYDVVAAAYLAWLLAWRGPTASAWRV
jgi:hypothetical protein